MDEPGFDPHQMTASSIRDFYSRLYDEGCPVMHTETHGGFYTLTSYDAVRAAAADWETFSSDAGIVLPRSPVKAAPIEYDPPEHTFWRNIFRDVLTVKAIRGPEDTVRRDATRLIDAFADRGSAELVSELAEDLPGNTICTLIGITDPDRIRRVGSPTRRRCPCSSGSSSPVTTPPPRAWPASSGRSPPTPGCARR